MRHPLPLPDRETIAPDERDAYDRCHARATSLRPEVSPYFGALMNSPPMAAAIMELGRVVRTRSGKPGSYTHVQREWVDQVLAADWSTNVVQRTHIPDGLAAGIRPEAIDALRSGDEARLDADERQQTEYIRAVVAGTVTEQQRNDLERVMGERGLLEYTAFITFLVMTIRLHQALGVPDPSDEEMDELLAGLRSGRIEMPDITQRLR